jgi:hypothetical protein
VEVAGEEHVDLALRERDHRHARAADHLAARAGGEVERVMRDDDACLIPFQCLEALA